jgi:hypothetical protein
MHGTKSGIPRSLSTSTAGWKAAFAYMITLHRTFTAMDRTAVERKISNTSPPRSPLVPGSSAAGPHLSDAMQREPLQADCRIGDMHLAALLRVRTLDGRYE